MIRFCAGPYKCYWLLCLCAERALQDVDLTLDGLYEAARELQPVDMVAGNLTSWKLQLHESGQQPLGEGMPELVRQIKQHSMRYGQGHQALAHHAADEECERELEQEEEQEEEVQQQLPAAEPAAVSAASCVC